MTNVEVLVRAGLWRQRCAAQTSVTLAVEKPDIEAVVRTICSAVRPGPR